MESSVKVVLFSFSNTFYGRNNLEFKGLLLTMSSWVWSNSNNSQRYCFKSLSRIFLSDGNVAIVGERLQKTGLIPTTSGFLSPRVDVVRLDRPVLRAYYGP